MVNIQKVFDELQKLKGEYKKLRDYMIEQYKNNPEYVELTEKIKVLKEKRKVIEDSVKAQNTGEVTKMEDLKIDMDSQKEMLNDAILSTVMKGETVEVKDQFEQLYLPIFHVTLTKEK